MSRSAYFARITINIQQIMRFHIFTYDNVNSIVSSECTSFNSLIIMDIFIYSIIKNFSYRDFLNAFQMLDNLLNKAVVPKLKLVLWTIPNFSLEKYMHIFIDM